MPMEQLPVNNNGGQGYGFILYQTELADFPKEIVIEQVFDRAQVLLVTFVSSSFLDKQGAQVTCIKMVIIFISTQWFGCIQFFVSQANLDLKLKLNDIH